jgi:sugar-specific transcriptional regulator TrmB
VDAPPTLPALDQIETSLSLASTEARAYRYLLEAGPATPTQIAAATNQSRGRIYETLRLLVERGLAREEPTRPLRYRPVPMADAVAVALAEAERRSQRLAITYARVAKGAATPPRPAPHTRPGDLSAITGREAVLAELARLAEQTRAFLLVAGGPAMAARLLARPDVLAPIRQAHERGRRVEVHLPLDLLEDATRDRLRERLGPAPLRNLTTAPPPGFVAANDTTALYVVAQPDDDRGDSGDDVGLRAASPAFVSAVRARLSPPQDARAAPQAGSDHVRRALAAAQSEASLLDPRPWGPTAAYQDAAQAAASRGVRLRILTHDEANADQAPWEVRQAPWAPASVLLVDRVEVHQYLDDGHAGHVRTSREPDEVRFYNDLFERLWERGRA